MDKNTVQQGRSMIEMLGVLAVIGVLSVGGIAGYSKAVERYRVNETVNQVSHIVQNTRDLFKNQPDFYKGLSFSDTNMSEANHPNRVLDSKAKIFPTALVKNDYKNLFEGNIRFFADGKFKAGDGKAFILRLDSITQESCIEIATRDWQSNMGLIALRIRGSGNNNSYRINEAYSGNCVTKYAAGDALICGKDMPATIEQAAAACDNEKDNVIVWKFY